MKTLVEFTVIGKPVPQGSKTRTRWGMREDNPATKPWRHAVRYEASQAYDGPLITAPVALEVVFTFQRPKSHYGTGRKANVLKPSAPLGCPTRPDLDKLLRAIGDSLTGTVLRDDAQIVRVWAKKVYGEPESARVFITQTRDLYDCLAVATARAVKEQDG